MFSEKSHMIENQQLVHEAEEVYSTMAREVLNILVTTGDNIAAKVFQISQDLTGFFCNAL